MAAAKSKSSIMSYLLGAFVEWILILMLLLNSIFSYLIFRFAHHFRLKNPCLICCYSSALDDADLVCHRHHATLFAASYAAHDDSINEKAVLELEGTGLAFTPENKSTQFIRDLFSDCKVVEFTFTEDDDEYVVQKDIVHDYAYRGHSGREPLMIDNFSACCLGHDESSADAIATASASGETKIPSQGALIKHKKVNDDECYSIAYTAEGDLVMDLCRNLAASDTVDAIPQIRVTTERQADQFPYQAPGQFLAFQNIENAERLMEVDEEDQPPEKSNDTLTESCLLYKGIERVNEQVDEVASTVYPPSPSWTEELVCEGISVPALVGIPSEHINERNEEGDPHPLSDSQSPPNVEELSEVPVERYQEQAPAPSLSLSAEDHSDFSQIYNQGSDQAEESAALFDTNSVQATLRPSTISLGLIKNNEDKLLGIPSSFDGAHDLNRNWLILEKRESATEESPDGCIISNIEYGEGTLTIDKLKTALQVERKALHALYIELEEERNASAVAACQTMAMINRLQEEKATVKMEALQYQRMMEEQSEYDQEALQLLNDLMVKREKEKEDLEKELNIYRKRVVDYETKERLMMLNRKEESLGSGSSSVSCTNVEDSDGVSIDLKVDMKNMNGFDGKEENGNNNTPLDDVLRMEQSFFQFEEERLSILEQLKVLEDNLFTFDDRDDGFHDCSYIMNGTENGCHNEVKGNYQQERRNIGPKAKVLLPLFYATVDGNENRELSRNENSHDFTSLPHSPSSISETESKSIYIKDEVDHVYERLQTLEADNEFLRHCFSSLNRGEKGLELLQEILQHLRNLRSVEPVVRKS